MRDTLAIKGASCRCSYFTTGLAVAASECAVVTGALFGVAGLAEGDGVSFIGSDAAAMCDGLAIKATRCSRLWLATFIGVASAEKTIGASPSL